MEQILQFKSFRGCQFIILQDTHFIYHNTPIGLRLLIELLPPLFQLQILKILCSSIPVKKSFFRKCVQLNTELLWLTTIVYNLAQTLLNGVVAPCYQTPIRCHNSAQ